NGIQKNIWLDLVPNPTTVKKIAFDNQTPQSIYVGFEGALLKTMNNGQSWNTLIDEHPSSKFFFGINVSELDNNRIFSAGWFKGDEPQSLVLYYSTDKGSTWKEDVFEEEQFGGVLDMLLKTEGNKERLFLALDKGGVYEVRIQG
uniref:WD40/YVTN/BNR-like repeat-containing protein n=1 Tax=Marivirga sp. TaxID=2018662 RepID=UPI0025E650E6